MQATYIVCELVGTVCWGCIQPWEEDLQTHQEQIRDLKLNEMLLTGQIKGLFEGQLTLSSRITFLSMIIVSETEYVWLLA